MISNAWICGLAEPYLRGLRSSAERKGTLQGYWFLHPDSNRAISPLAIRTQQSSNARPAAGFFVGYLVDAKGYEYLKPAPPECLIFAAIEPLGGGLHRRLVAEDDGLVRKTAAYIRWLTHRPPRFKFFEDERIALVRHQSMQEWPREKYKHFSRNFFIETLAWLVRSGLVRRLLAEPLTKLP